MQRSREILSFWFGSPSVTDADGSIAPRMSLWFEADDTRDDEIRDQFGTDLEKASSGLYEDWEQNAQSHLALILLLDQFSRNIHRGTARAFAFDDQALACALDAIDSNHDRAVSPVARAFYYLPLEHAEELGHQQRCVQLFEELVDSACEDQRPLLEGFLDYARQHHDVIERFGRFPHRNPILGRESTAEELAYLDDGGATYGQRPD